jgi:trehalose synthase
MWKSRPVVASAVGGILDQVEDGRTGVLLQDPRDLDTYGNEICALLEDTERAALLGRNAREHVRNNFLANRHARQYIELLGAVLAERASSVTHASAGA